MRYTKNIGLKKAPSDINIVHSVIDEALADLMASIENDADCEGVIGDCRWMYNCADRMLSLSTQTTFEGWANSRLVDVDCNLWTDDDPDFKTFVGGLAGLFDGGVGGVQGATQNTRGLSGACVGKRRITECTKR